MLEIIEKRFHKQKQTWENVQGKIFESHPENRMGDEIQLSALYKYFKQKNIEIHYQDANQLISMINIMPDSLVKFSRKNKYKYPVLDLIGLWNWSPFLQANNFYTENQIKYDDSQTEFDCVFIPYLAPDYYKARGIQNPEEVYLALKSKFKKTICVIDKNKKNHFKLNDNSLILSDNIYTSFKYIEKSKHYIGCDTGMTHYAGSIGHPRMTLLYPDDSDVLKVVMWQRYAIAYIFGEKDVLRFIPSSLPCCNPKNYNVINFTKNVDTKILLSSIKT